MTAESDSSLWSGLSADFEILGVRIVAMLGSDGGAIVENVRRLYCSEGRQYVSERTRQSELHRLEYGFGFTSSDKPDPAPSVTAMGRIIVSGHHTNGHRIEIRGSGWIGYDETGNIQGRFDTPPVIITEDCSPHPDEGETGESEARHSGAGFPLPPQFLQADLRARASRGAVARQRIAKAQQLRGK